MTVALAFGPLRCGLALADGLVLPPEFARWQVAPASGDPLWELRVAPAAGAHDGASVTGTDEAVITVSGDHPRALIGALATALAQRAPTVGAVVLHAAAVTVAGGVALLFAPSGTGKSTFAAIAGPRSFAHNAVVVTAGDPPTAWAFPFAGDARPALDQTGARAVRLLARLERGTAPGFEWLPRSLATTTVMRHCARASTLDALAVERFMIASALPLRAPFGRLLASRDPRDLDPLDSALAKENRP